MKELNFSLVLSSHETLFHAPENLKNIGPLIVLTVELVVAILKIIREKMSYLQTEHKN